MVAAIGAVYTQASIRSRFEVSGAEACVVGVRGADRPGAFAMDMAMATNKAVLARYKARIR
jgi:hypothetical protein